MKNLTFIAAILAVLPMTACDSKTKTAEIDRGTPAPVGSGAVQKVLATKPTGEAGAIHKVRTQVKPGDDITIKGRIMGNMNPFVEGRAAFILGDTETMKACSDIPGDSCDTPWDNCCDSPEVKKAGIATIQIVDESGRVLKEGLEGTGGLEKLAHVTVSGKVAEGSSPELLLINASAISAGK